jgi:hypothetical protein
MLSWLLACLGEIEKLGKIEKWSLFQGTEIAELGAFLIVHLLRSLGVGFRSRIVLIALLFRLEFFGSPLLGR